jgi:hypothetical protein
MVNPSMSLASVIVQGAALPSVERWSYHIYQALLSSSSAANAAHQPLPLLPNQPCECCICCIMFAIT